MLTLCLSMGAQTETTIIEWYRVYVQKDMTVQAGDNAQLYLVMDKRNPIATWSCTLVLPEGVTYKGAALYPDAYPDGYNAEFTATENEDGSVSFSCSGEDGVAMYAPQQTGNIIATVTVDIPETFAPGKIEVTTKGITLVEVGGDIRNYTNNNSEIVTEVTVNPIPKATITFDLNGAPGEIAPITLAVGDPIPAPDDPEWEGYVFKGWDPAIPAEMPADGITVKAIWAKLYNVTVQGEGVTVDKTQPEEGESVTVTVSEIPNKKFVALYVNDEDVTSLLTENNTYVIENVDKDYIVYAVYETTAETVVITTEYTPFSSDNDLTFDGDDLKAYIAAGFNTTTNQALLVRVTDVPAHTGVLLAGSKGEFDIPVANTTNYFVNLFKAFPEGGMLYPVADDNSVNFVYGVVNGEEGFYRVEENGVQLPANSAYLQLPGTVAGSNVKIGFIFEDDVVDGVTGIEATESQAIFDLQGRRVNKTAKGIYIVSGKKIAVK